MIGGREGGEGGREGGGDSSKTKATDLAKEINSSGTTRPLASFTPNTAAPVKKVSLVCGWWKGGREGGRR